MKKSLMIIFLIGSMTACKKSGEFTADQKAVVEKSAREFCDHVFKLWEELKFDELMSLFPSDGIFSSNGTFMPVKDLKNWAEQNKHLIKKITYTYDTMAIHAVDPNNVSTSLRYFYSQTDSAGKENLASGIINLVLNKTAENWKIVTYTEYADWSPLIISGTVNKNRSELEVDLNKKFNSSMFQAYGLINAEIILYKKAGKKALDCGLDMGRIFAATWNKNAGFEGLKNGMIYNSQLFSTRSEIVELTDDRVKLRLFKDYKQGLYKNVTDKDIIDFYKGVAQPIGDYMGGKIEIGADGDYINWTITKK